MSPSASSGAKGSRALVHELLRRKELGMVTILNIISTLNHKGFSQKNIPKLLTPHSSLLTNIFAPKGQKC